VRVDRTRLAEILGTDPVTLYVGGVEAHMEAGDEPSSVWLLLGDDCLGSALNGASDRVGPTSREE
jgi:hypothetical protein